METIDLEDFAWKYLSLIGDERVINLQRTKVHVFSDSVMCLGKILEPSQQNDSREHRLRWFRTSQEYRNFDRIDGEPMEFEWNIFPGYNTLQLSEKKSKVYCTDWEKHQKISQEESYSCRCSTTFLVEQKTKKKNVWQTLDSFRFLQEDLVKDNGHSLVLVPKKKWYSMKEDSPQ